MRKLLLSLVLCSAALTTAAHADTFNFYGTTQSGAVGTGFITTDSSGTINGGTVTFSGGGTFDTGGGTFDFYYGGYNNGYTYANLYKSSTDTDFDLNVKDTLVGVKTAQVCVDNLCSYSRLYSSGSQTAYIRSVVGPNLLTSGTLTLQAPIVIDVPTAATPEPSSLILLGTGALGMARAVRRRFLARA